MPNSMREKIGFRKREEESSLARRGHCSSVLWWMGYNMREMLSVWGCVELLVFQWNKCVSLFSRPPHPRVCPQGVDLYLSGRGFIVDACPMIERQFVV